MDSSQLYSHGRWSVYVCVLCGRSSGLLPPNCESLTLSVSEWSTVASLSLYCCYSVSSLVCLWEFWCSLQTSTSWSRFQLWLMGARAENLLSKETKRPDCQSIIFTFHWVTPLHAICTNHVYYLGMRENVCACVNTRAGGGAGGSRRVTQLLLHTVRFSCPTPTLSRLVREWFGRN